MSPTMVPRCRYVPTCSEYMKEAVRSEGALRGGMRGLARIFRCAPWGESGLDLHEKQS